jgi:GMP synthase-like glutamine amidotransferase
MNPVREELTLLISHQDQVTSLPENATVIASSDFCPFAAYHINDQVLCFQGHPEFIHDYSRALAGDSSASAGRAGLQRKVWPAWTRASRHYGGRVDDAVCGAQASGLIR